MMTAAEILARKHSQQGFNLSGEDNQARGQDLVLAVNNRNYFLCRGLFARIFWRKERMEILAGKGNSTTISVSRLPETQKEADLFDLLMRFINLTKEERLRAGIYVGSEGRDWRNQAALVFPPNHEE